ncbi:GNAT family N-acetyltransferase [Streptomyces sp. NPDC002643]
MTLRALEEGDAPAVRRVYSGASVRFLGGLGMTREEAEQYVARARAWGGEEPVAQYVLGIDRAGDLVGVVKLRRANDIEGHVSYVLREDTWGRGYATEAVRLLVDFAFTTADMNLLGAKHHPDNPASGRVLLKSGFEYVGTLPAREIPEGRIPPYLAYERRRPSPITAAPLEQGATE